MLKVSEVFEKQAKIYNERPDGSDYATFKKVYDTRELLLNPDYIVSARAYDLSEVSEAQFSQDSFPAGSKFTALVLDGHSFRSSQMIVVGSFEKIARQLGDHHS